MGHGFEINIGNNMMLYILKRGGLGLIFSIYNKNAQFIIILMNVTNSYAGGFLNRHKAPIKFNLTPE